MLRMSRNNQRIGVSDLEIFHSVQLRDTSQSWQSVLPMVHRQYTMHGLSHSRLPLAQQQAVAHQLWLECHQRITLDLLTHMLPIFPTCAAHMSTVVTCHKVDFIQVS